MHESSDKFQFRPDTTTDSRVICPWASEKSMYKVVNTLAPSCLIGSSLFLQLRLMCGRFDLFWVKIHYTPKSCLYTTLCLFHV